MERANISSNRIPHPNNSVCDNVLGRRVRVHKCSTFKLESCEQLLIQLLDSCDGGLKREFPPRALYRGRLDRLDACGACFWNNNNFKISSRSSFRSISPREDCLCESEIWLSSSSTHLGSCRHHRTHWARLLSLWNYFFTLRSRRSINDLLCFCGCGRSSFRDSTRL